jgi:hypothetical protein
MKTMNSDSWLAIASSDEMAKKKDDPEFDKYSQANTASRLVMETFNLNGVTPDVGILTIALLFWNMASNTEKTDEEALQFLKDVRECLSKVKP